MNLLEKLVGQFADKVIKPKDTLQDWFDTLKEEEFLELERLIGLQEEDPENEETELLGQLVVTLYSIETNSITLEDSEIKVAEIEDEEFFKLLNSFLFLLPFYYWVSQDLVKLSTKLSFLATQKNEIVVTLTEYGKGMEPEEEAS